MIQTRLSPEEARAVLGLASAAGRDEIARAFRAAAKRLHPDAGGEAGAFGRAVEAYRRLIPHRGVDESATRQRRRRFAEAWTAQALRRRGLWSKPIGQMSHNTFGHLFRVTTWGESHGPALGCVVDGCPPGLPLTAPDIQVWLDRRRPGAGKYVSQRREPDAVRILSGVFPDAAGAQVTTGTPISLVIDNIDQRSRDYSDIASAFRPGHADFAYFAKYGVRDYRGGGRQSARETAARVAAGAIARIVLGAGVGVRAALVQIGPYAIDRGRWDWAETHCNPFWSPDAAMVEVWEEHLEKTRKAGSSTGAIVEVEAAGVPAGWGAPVYGKLDAELAGALMSINAAKGVEIGAGFAAAALSGEENADEMRAGNDGPEFLSNNAGGILGGISTGAPVIARVAFKPTSSILAPRRSINEAGEEIEVRTTGRHDPCVGIRGVPVVEAMAACVLADAFLRHRGQTGGGAFMPGSRQRL